MAKLIITNGDAAVLRLKAAGIEGQLLPWQDMLHDGPVPAVARLADVSDVRARFLSTALGQPVDALRADFARRDAQLEAHAAFEEVELWFEHDLYDQIQLIQIIDYFSSQPERSGLFLVQAPHYLGVLDEPELRALAGTRRPLSSAQMETARQAFAAFRAATPEALAAFAAEPHDALPHLAPALRRLLAELPAPGSGLSLTEERILRHLARGPATAAQLLAVVSAMDEARFLADLPFFLRLDALAFAPEPLIAGVAAPVSACGPLSFTPGEASAAEQAYAAREIRLTEAGGTALAGTFDHALENGVSRFLGGTRIGPAALWRYDRYAASLIPPPSA